MSSSDQPQAPPPPRPSPHETEAMPTPLTKLEFSYAGTSWPLADFVAMVRSQQKVVMNTAAFMHTYIHATPFSVRNTSSF